MRLSINLDDDLYAMARSHAIATKTSLSKAVGDLLRQRTASSPVDTSSGSHPLSGFPISEGRGQPLTEAEIQAAKDEDLVRSKEIMGRTGQEIEKANS